MNKKFWIGLVTGIIGTLVLALGTLGIYHVLDSTLGGIRLVPADEAKVLEEQAVIAQSAGNGAAGAENVQTEDKKRAEFNAKLDTMLTYIDYFYYGDYSEDDIYDMMLHAVPYALDDLYAEYYNPEEFASLMEQTSGNYCGIGIYVSQNTKTMELLVVSPIGDSPADKAGMLPGDIIVAVDGENVVGMSITDVVARMKGKEGTQVTVTVEREITADDETIIETHDLTMVRAVISIQYVASRMLENNIGYIQITEFEDTADEQFVAALDDFVEKGIDGLILDFRDNPGGSVDAGVNILERLLKRDEVMFTTEDKSGYVGKSIAYNADCFEKPIVILMNGNSASCSEIVAGALKDLGYAKILGTQSFGKGIIQSVVPIVSDSSALKLTSARYFTPNGECIHGIGIAPDREVELDEGLDKIMIEKRTEDNQIDAALEYILEIIASEN